MKTTLNLPDDLFTTIKLRAVKTKKTLQTTISELLQIGLTNAERVEVSRRVSLPLLTGGPPGRDFSGAELAQLLEKQELDDLS